MERTTISLPEELHDRLRLLALQRKTSMAHLIREALEAKVAEMRPKPKSIGLGASKYTDTSIRAGEEKPKPRQWR